MTSTSSKPRTGLKISLKYNSESTQSVTPEPSVRKRTQRRVISDEETDDDDQDPSDSAPPSSPPINSSRPTHTDDSEVERTPEPELSPLPQPASSSRHRRMKGGKSTNELPAKKKRLQQEADSDEDYDAGVVSEVDETLIVNTKRQSKPTAKAKVNKGKRKFSIGARDESRPSRPSAISKDAITTKRARETAQVDDDQVDVVGEMDARQTTRSPSPPKESSAPPPKRRKYPTITKNKGAATKTDTASSSKTGPGASAKPAATDLAKPTGSSRVPPAMVGSADFDLRDQSVYNSLFKQPGGSTPRSGLTRQKEEEKRKLNRMREEARAKRMTKMATSFDLQTEFEKIKSFEDTMRMRKSRCIFPNNLAGSWKDAYDKARQAAAEEAWSQIELGQREEGELQPHLEPGP